MIRDLKREANSHGGNPRSLVASAAPVPGIPPGSWTVRGGDEGLMLLPMLGGFVTNYLAALVQAVYPSFDEMIAATKQAEQ